MGAALSWQVTVRPDLGALDQAGVRQHVEMLHDGGQRDREGPRQLADGEPFLLVEPRQQGAPGRIGEGGEGAVEHGGFDS